MADVKMDEFVGELLAAMVEAGASDLFLTVGFPPAFKVDGSVKPVSSEKLTAEHVMALAETLMNERQLNEFKATNECNFAISREGAGRFRVNACMQQGRVALVLRVINTTIPKLDDLKLPEVLKDISMAKRGLVILVGATGSGKSTSLAAMVGHRNAFSRGHIITIEDPIEYVHEHGHCVVTQREVGVDTADWHTALKNTLRQAPDVILIGEIRDRETMEFALAFAETGHLCMSTLHANSANQALDRIINFFPEERRQQLLMDLSLNLKAFVSQRLIPNKSGSGRVAAIEILLNSPLIGDLIFKGEVQQIKEVMKSSKEMGMKTFDMHLFELYEEGLISFEEAMKNADSVNDLRLRIKLEGAESSAPSKASSTLSFQDDDGRPVGGS